MLIPEALHEDFLAFVDDEGTSGNSVAVDLYERWAKATATCGTCGHERAQHDGLASCCSAYVRRTNSRSILVACGCTKFVPKPEPAPDSASA